MKKYSSNTKGAGGFTLIELIVVIVILGILAATALPKFSSLSADARAAQMQTVAGALNDAAIMLHGIVLAEQASAVGAISGVEGTPNSITYTAYYPTADAAGIAALLSNTSVVGGIASGIVTGTNFASGGTGAAGEVDFYPDVNRKACLVKYHEATVSATGILLTPAIVDASAAIALNCG